MPNRVRFDGRPGRFYEVWYFIFNDLATGDGFWIRYTLLNPGETHPEAGAALWFAYTCRADPSRSLTLKHVVPPGLFTAPHGEFRLHFGAGVLEEGRLWGAFTADDHSVAWDLQYGSSPEPHYFFGSLLRRFTETRTSVTVPNPRILLAGTVTIDGRQHPIEDGPGHQAHHWGVERAPRWIWAHCCAFDGADATLELLSSEGPGGIPVTFLNLHTTEGALLCSSPASLLANRATAGLGFWHFEGRAGERRVVADVTVDPRFVQKFVYTSPAYRSSECWNTQVGDCLVRVFRGGRPGTQTLERVLRAHGTAAAEVHDERPERIPYVAWKA